MGIKFEALIAYCFLPFAITYKTLTFSYIIKD
jgi:hypothetical protein